jgi:hypothetical protein
VPAHGETGPALDLRYRLIDEAAGNGRDRSAIRADDVLMMAATGLEPGSTVSEIEPFQLAGVTEANQGPKD